MRMNKASAIMKTLQYSAVMKRNCRKKQSSQFSKQFSPLPPNVMSIAGNID